MQVLHIPLTMVLQRKNYRPILAQSKLLLAQYWAFLKDPSLAC